MTQPSLASCCTRRYAAWLIAAAIGELLCYIYISRLGDCLAHAWQFFTGYGIAFVLFMAVVFRRPRRLSHHDDVRLLAIILGAAVIFRLVLLTAAPRLSTDRYRYRWDARLQAGGVNPYRYPPCAPQVRRFRDSTYVAVEVKTWPTIYPPGALLSFRLGNLLTPDSILGYKFVYTLCDGIVIALLTILLRMAVLPMCWVVTYAWCPLPIIEIAGNGHLDTFGIAWMLAALISIQLAGEYIPWLSGSLLSVAVMSKGYAALLVPPFLRKGGWRATLAMAATAALLFLPFADAGKGLTTGVYNYLFHFDRNNLAFNTVLSVGALLGGRYRTYVRLGCGVLLAGISLWAAFQPLETAADWARIGRLVFGAFLLCTNAVFPWYVIWLLPFLAFRPSFAWLTFAALVSLNYLTYYRGPLPAGTTWPVLLEYGVLYALLLGEAVAAWWRWRINRGDHNDTDNFGGAVMSTAASAGEGANC